MTTPMRRAQEAVVRTLVVFTLVGAGALATGMETPAIADESSAAGSDLVPVYVVRDSYQGQPEELREIAKRFLGTDQAAAEIASLNDDVVQADGGRVRLDGSLQAGWVLLLPPRAAGTGVQIGEQGATSAEPVPTDLLPIILGGALVVVMLAALAALWLQRRRRSVDVHPRSPRAVTVNRDAWLIDRAMRVMLTRSVAEQIRPATPYLVSVDEERVVLHLTAPRSQAPTPFRATDGATEWFASIRDVQDVAIDPATGNRASTVVVVGETDSVLHAIDLGLAGGVVQVTGDPNRRRALIADWGRQLRSAPWADSSLPIFVTGFAAGAIAESRYIDSVAAADPDLTAGGPLVLLADDLDRRDQSALEETLTTPGAPRAVVIGGEYASPRWAFDVAADGSVHSDLFRTDEDNTVSAS